MIIIRMNPNGGFTLVEILLSVALIVGIVSVGAPLFVTWQTTNDVAIATHSVANALYQAQLYARAGKQDSSWGVQVSSGMIVVFSGSSYVLRDVDQDIITSIPTTIVFSGIDSVVFSQLSGTPDVEGSIIITGLHGATQTIGLESWGARIY